MNDIKQLARTVPIELRALDRVITAAQAELDRVIAAAQAELDRVIDAAWAQNRRAKEISAQEASNPLVEVLQELVMDDVAKIEREAIVAWLRERFPAPEYPTDYLPLVLADAIERSATGTKQMTNDKDSEVLIELREAIREAGVKRTTTRLYAAVMAFDAAWNTRQLTQSDALKIAAQQMCAAWADGDVDDQETAEANLRAALNGEEPIYEIADGLRQPTQSNALAPIGAEGKYVGYGDLELSCRVTAHIEGWLEVEFLHPLDRSSAIIRPSRFIPITGAKQMEISAQEASHDGR
jgi:hypothetical protein